MTTRTVKQREAPAATAGLAQWALRAWSILLILAGCAQPPAQAPPPPKVNVVQALARDVTEWDEYTTRFEAVESVEVRPQVSGYLQSIHFKDGALVTKGDLLFLIDPRPYEAALRHAEADLTLAQSRLQLAKKNFARGAGLLKDNAISVEEADIRESTLRQAEASVDVSQAAVDAAKLNVEFTQIRAAVSGRIGRKLVTEGNLISGGAGTQSTLLTTIVTLDPIYAYFEADERSFLKYAHLALIGERRSSREYKNPVRVGLGDEVGFPREGVMDFVDNQLDRGTGTIIGRAVLPNPDLTLTPGLFGRLRLPGSGTYHAVLLPDEAIGFDQSQKFVFVVGADNKAAYRRVQTGPLVDGLRVIREGITPEDWVIVSGLQRVRPGITVDPTRQAIEQPGTPQGTPAPTPAEADAQQDEAHR